MYVRTVGDRELHFQVSGMLWQRSLIMQDVETESAWSHLLGRAMDGELEGEELEVLPSVITDWATWRAGHPDSTVLNMSRTAREFLRDFQKQPGRFVLGVRLGSEVKAYPFDALKADRVVNDEVGGWPVVVTFDLSTATARIFSRRTGRSRTLSFRPSGQGAMTDAETGSTWDAGTGDATAGKLEGEQLRPLPGIPSFRRAWEKFHPGTGVYRP